MADLGPGSISGVVVTEIKVTPQPQTVSGEKVLFQVNDSDKNIKVTPTLVSISGKIATVLEPPIQSTFKAR